MIDRPRPYPRCANSAGFTLTEVMVTIGVIALLGSLLLPALQSARSSAYMAKSMSNMRQIALFSNNYSEEHRDTVLPSLFNHQANLADGLYPGLTRMNPDLPPEWRARGTWADLLWSIHGLSPERDGLSQWRFDSPNKAFYEAHPDFENVLRSAAANTDNAPGTWSLPEDSSNPDDLARPYGDGAKERHLPGYFAANNYFNADPTAPDYSGYISQAQVKLPSQSLYLIDSLAGEVIEDEIPPFSVACAGDPPPLEVDFRYSGSCLMMFLDGHVSPENRWQELDDLLSTRGIHVRNLATGIPSGPVLGEGS